MKIATILATLASKVIADTAGDWDYNDYDWVNAGFPYCDGVPELDGENFQSPIDIPAEAFPVDSRQLKFTTMGGCDKIIMTNSTSSIGATIMGDHCDGDVHKVTYGGNDYNMLQFHYHAPSENTMHGELKDAEVHLVHMSEEGEFLVVGVFLESDVSAPQRGGISSLLEAGFDGEIHNLLSPALGFDAYAQLLPEDDLSYVAFEGSFTTPDCTPDVQWFVMENSVRAHPNDIEAMKALWGNSRTDGIESIARDTDNSNNRPVQPRKNRPIVASEAVRENEDAENYFDACYDSQVKKGRNPRAAERKCNRKLHKLN